MAGHVLSCHGAPSLLYTFMFDMTLMNQSVFTLTRKVTDSHSHHLLFFLETSYNKRDIYDGKLHVLSAHRCHVEFGPTFAFVWIRNVTFSS